MSNVICEYCGDEFDERGLGAHQRYCDAGEESTSETDSSALSGLEARAQDRDNGKCRRCNTTESLGVHEVDTRVGRELANVVTLCASCEDVVAGLHPRTKRSKIRE